MDIRVNKADQRKINRMFDKLEKLGSKEVDIIIDRNGLQITRDIKMPPIPVDTGNLRNNVVYNSREKAIESKAPYSGFLEFGTKFQKAQPYFYGKINTGLKRLILDLNNAINRALR